MGFYMRHERAESLVAKLDEARAKVSLTIHNDPMPSARLIASVILMNQVIAELRGEEYVGPADISEVSGIQ